MATLFFPEDVPIPRLCKINTWDDWYGYGFYFVLGGENNAGLFIGKVDSGSPADLAGMKEGDKLVEMNGVKTTNENQKNVVETIAHGPNAANLLVLDVEADDYYKKHKIVVSRHMPDVLVITCPDLSSGKATAVKGGRFACPDPSTLNTG